MEAKVSGTLPPGFPIGFLLVSLKAEYMHISYITCEPFSRAGCWLHQSTGIYSTDTIKVRSIFLIYRSLFEQHCRSGHFVDPALRAILESSLTPDDNDLHVSNLVDTPVLAIHGFVVRFFGDCLGSNPILLCRGDDENVPVWHTRELVATLKSWYPRADVT